MPAADALRGLLAGVCQHLLRRHLRIGQEPAELQRLIAVLGQSMHSQRPTLLHRPQQRHAHTRQPPVAKLAKPRFEDTTELHFPTHEASKHGFGKAGNGEDIGLFLHPVLAVDAATGGVIGLVDCVVLNRTAGKVSDRRQRGAEEKGSRR